mmetsp:Transcript_6914/g.22422  ORF Transcript_6914/g.22422 Transcript_6914/m.22422 type:complete len:250 (-) Transcript_6914:18-767(-)
MRLGGGRAASMSASHDLSLILFSVISECAERPLRASRTPKTATSPRSGALPPRNDADPTCFSQTSRRSHMEARSSTMPYFFLILPWANDMPSAPTVRIRVASTMPKLVSAYARASRHSAKLRVMFGYIMSARSFVAHLDHFCASADAKTSSGAESFKSSSTMRSDSTTTRPSSMTAIGTLRWSLDQLICDLVSGLTSMVCSAMPAWRATALTFAQNGQILYENSARRAGDGTTRAIRDDAILKRRKLAC